MKHVNILLNSIDAVKDFVNTVTQFDCDMDLVSSRYTIDAKSIMGIFSLDLAREIELRIHDDAKADEVIEKIKAYIVE